MTPSSRGTSEPPGDEPQPEPQPEPEPDDGLFDVLAAMRPPQEDALAQSLGRSVRRTLVGTPTEPFRLGRFTVLDLLGGGAMGTVFVAYDPELDRKVALKVLRVQGEAGRRAVLRESRALARLSHPRIVTVYDVGVVDAQVFVVMEYVRGPDLGTWLREERSTEEILTVVTGAARGLAAAHDANVVHLDLKPDNLLVDDEGHARLIDFGVARFLEELSTDAGRTPAKRSGTPAYMAPERLRGEPGDPRADQYSLCVVAWEAVFGRRPGPDDEPPTPAELPGRVVEALRRGLRPDPDERFPSVRDLADALEPAPLRRSGRWLGIFGALGLGLGAYALGQSHAETEAETCPSPWADIDETWNDARATDLAAAFFGVNAPFAESTWSTVSAGLARYASAWSDAERRACEARRGPEPDDRLERRLACLEDRRLHYDALIERFALADLQTVTRAVEAVEALPSLDACDDPSGPDASLAGAAEQRAQRAQLRRTLAQIRAQLTSGSRGEEVLASLERALADARSLAHPPLVADVLITAASLTVDGSRDDLERGLTRAREALELSIEHEHPWLAANAIIQLVSIQRDLDTRSASEDLLDLADALSRRLDEPPNLAFDLAIARGNGSFRAGQCTDAIEEYERARTIAERAERPGWLLYVLANIGNCHTQLGHYDVASGYMDEAGALAESLLGAEHPWFLHYYNAVGNLHLAQDQLEQSLTQFRRGMAVAVSNYGEEHPMVGLLHNSIGMAQKDLGRFEQAVETFDAAASTFERIRGEDDPGFAIAQCGRADALLQLGRPEPALAAAERAVAIQAEVLPPRSCTAFGCRAVLANILAQTGREAEIIELLESDLERHSDTQCDPYTRGRMELILARALWTVRGADARRRVLELVDSAIPVVDEPTRLEARRFRTDVGE